MADQDQDSQVFVVDSDPPLRQAVSRILSRNGYRTQSFATVADFSETLPRLGRGCVLCDHAAGGVNGFEVLALLAGRRDELPVLMMVFLGDLEIAVSALRQGAADVLEKPLTAPALLTALAATQDKLRRTAAAASMTARLRLRLQAMTGAEDRLLHDIAAGVPAPELASRHGVSHRTIERRTRQLVLRLGVRSLDEALELLARSEA